MNKKIIFFTGALVLAVLAYIVADLFFLKNKEMINENTIVNNINTAESAKYTIIAFGDSLTAGYGLPLSDSYPKQLEEKLKNANVSVQVINSGVSGETSRGSLERAEFIASQNSDLIIFGIGGNDMLRGLSVKDLEENMENTIKILIGKKRKVVLLKMEAPLNSGLKYKKDFDSVYINLAQKYNLKLIPFIVPEVFLDSKYKLEDSIHPNEEGYKILVDKYVYPFIYKELK